MSQAFIVCPNTDRFVYVGLNLEWPDLDMLMMGEQTLTCPACGDIHHWDQDELVLRSDGGDD